ncbi:hypothetical protein MLD38_010686 [Melastoma candidum]|uniref:Uncharacterized protein n=1 Tax=Melastoma candidum TaxID=119954 RepID=A0ACB9R0P4_9MYRT|nr:hypothetical protein MLD38_010686 [Melastoma candidum]
MDSFTHVPPGFRFHPTDEELVDYYLRKKVASKRIDLDVIKDVDLYKIEPWDLQELCKIGNDEQREWVFKKRLTTMRKIDEYDSPCWDEDQVRFMPDFDSPRRISQHNQPYLHQNPCKQEGDMTYTSPGKSFPQMPHLESPKLAVASNSLAAYGYERAAFAQDELMIRRIPQQNMGMQFNTNYGNQAEHGLPYQMTDWRVLDKFVASQLSHDNAPRGSQYTDSNSYQVGEDMNVESGISSSEILQEFASSSTSPTAFQVDLWK